MGRKELYNSKTAIEYKIRKGSIIFIMLKSKGGMNNANISSFTNSNFSYAEPHLKDLLNKYELISYYPKFLEEKIGLKNLKIMDLNPQI